MNYKESTSHSDFLKQMIGTVKKGACFALFPRPHIVDPSNVIHLFGSCAACGEALDSAFFVGTFMLACRHQYHPLCFSATILSRKVCAQPGCGMMLPEAAKCWTSRQHPSKGMHL